MMTVTTCQPQGKGKVKLGFDNGTVLTAYYSEIRPFYLKEEAAVTKEDYSRLIGVITKRTKKRALHLLGQMDYTEAKLREKLKQGGYPPECIDAAVSYVKEFHYLDDSRYAAAFVRYRQDKMSRRQLFMKLLARGIPGELAKQTLEAEYRSDERIQIARLLEKRHFVKENADEKEFRRTYQYLARRGFNSSEILSEMTSGGI